MRLYDFLLTNEDSVDVFDNCRSVMFPAICGGYQLTDAGKDEFAGILNADVKYINSYEIVVHTDTVENSELLERLCWLLAGYVSASYFDKMVTMLSDFDCEEEQYA